MALFTGRSWPRAAGESSPHWKIHSLYGMIKVSMITNMLAPYRVSFYNALSKHVDFTLILDTLSEFNRSWDAPDDIDTFEIVIQDCKSFIYKRHRKDVGYVEERQFHFSERTYFKLRERRPDVVITIEYGFKTLWALIYGKLHGVPVILVSEGTLHTEGHVGWFKALVRKLLVSQSSRFWSNGPASTALLLSYGASPQCVDEGMTGIDTTEWRKAVESWKARRQEVRDELHLEGRVFLFSGSLSPRKGIPQLMEAVEKVALEPNCPPFSLLLLGSGEEAEWVQQWIARHPNIKIVTTGFVQPSELPKYFAAADWAILPTLDDNWPLATLETLVAGLPQLFSIYNGATADLCRPGTGISFDPLDPESFKQAIVEALRSPLECVSEALIRNAADYYSPESQGERAVRSLKLAIGN
jgi:glycosyltransferase involved in cell wall biosynthesis